MQALDELATGEVDDDRVVIAEPGGIQHADVFDGLHAPGIQIAECFLYGFPESCVTLCEVSSLAG